MIRIQNRFGVIEEIEGSLVPTDEQVEAMAREWCCGDCCGFRPGCSGVLFSPLRTRRALATIGSKP